MFCNFLMLSVFYMTAISPKIVVFFCLFGHHMCNTFIISLLPDRVHYALTQIVQFAVYQQNVLTEHKSFIYNAVKLCSFNYAGFWDFGRDSPAFFIVQTLKNFSDSNKTALKPKSGIKNYVTIYGNRSSSTSLHRG